MVTMIVLTWVTVAVLLALTMMAVVPNGDNDNGNLGDNGRAARIDHGGRCA